MAMFMQQPTLMGQKSAHSTYMADLEKVSKILPVASFGSLSTLAGTDDESTPREKVQNINVGMKKVPSAAELVWPGIQDTKTVLETLKDQRVIKRAEIVSKYGAGQDYKLARLARLEQRLAAAETIEADDLTALHDYDTDVLGMMWAFAEKKELEPVIGGRAGGMYIQKVKPNDAWARLDCDSDLSEAMDSKDGDYWALPAARVAVM